MSGNSALSMTDGSGCVPSAAPSAFFFFLSRFCSGLGHNHIATNTNNIGTPTPTPTPIPIFSVLLRPEVPCVSVDVGSVCVDEDVVVDDPDDVVDALLSELFDEVDEDGGGVVDMVERVL